MGAAWCRERAATAHNSKSPLDRVIVQCVNQIYPSSETRSSRGTTSCNDASRNRSKQLIGQPVPVHTRNRPISATHAINALSSWQDVSLRVPDSSDEGGPPVPPPRKKKIWREQHQQQPPPRQSEKWKSVPRPPPPQPPKAEKDQDSSKISKKRRQKTLSSVSLPNYNDMSLSVYAPGTEKSTSGTKTPPRNESCISLPGKSSGLSSFSGSTVEKIENCVRRCRSFGAFKPEPLKIKTPPMNGRHSSESDDSFDGLDDWDLRVIEHCEAHEVSPVQTMLPPQRQRKSNNYIYDDAVDQAQRRSSGYSPSNCSVLEGSEDVYNQLKCDSVQEEGSIKNQENHIIKFEEVKLVPTIDLEQNVQKSVDSRNNVVKFDTTSSTEEKVADLGKENIETVTSGDNEKVVVYDFVNNIRKASISEKQKMANGFHDISPGLKTPPPTPENTKAKNSVTEDNIDEQIGHSSLLRLLKEYQSADGKLEDTGAQNVLKGLGIPPTLKEADFPGVHKPQEVTCGSRGSSGRSSMTPSLSELEAALSDLLEASASKTGADEDDDDVMPVSMVTTSTAVQQSLRVISPKPYSSFSNSFHPIQNTPGKQTAETSA